MRQSGRALSGLRVLVVEDVADLREMLGALLRREGAVVREARTGGEALAIAGAWELDGALTDLGLPDVSGEVVVAGIHETSGGRTPVAVLSAASEQDLQRAVEIGADRVFQKPVDWETLRRYLASWKRAAA